MENNLINLSINEDNINKIIELNTFVNRADIKPVLAQASQEIYQDLTNAISPKNTSIELNLLILQNVPAFIKTLRVAGFTPAFVANNEVHPNSDQFTLSLQGHGKTIVETTSGNRIDHYGSGSRDVLSNIWHIAHKNQFHQHIAGSETWIIAALHTAEQIITNYR